jgi:hypothetical protein
MRQLTHVIRCACRSGLPFLLLAGTCTLETTRGFASEPIPETIQASSTQAGNTVTLTLIVYRYSTPSDLQILSQAFQDG